ncbi:MAG TPA: cytochrome c oxidase subunit 4 [Acidimicrobiales bacterium]|nr:cytochrome c oxidase subunit 4 [Acidimicrobiales bacterium]
MSEPAVPGTEGARGHELRPPVDDRKVPWRVFVCVGAFVAVIATVYAATSYEEGGTVMLILAAVLALWVGSFLWLKQREQEAAGETAPGEGGEGGEGGEAMPEAEAAAAPGRVTASAGPPAREGPAGEVAHYLPHASAWPFAIGLGAATLANGLVLGLWVIVPGAAVMVAGIVGFVRQTRRRD